jgi:hypothetical protein
MPWEVRMHRFYKGIVVLMNSLLNPYAFLMLRLPRWNHARLDDLGADFHSNCDSDSPWARACFRLSEVSRFKIARAPRIPDHPTESNAAHPPNDRAATLTAPGVNGKPSSVDCAKKVGLDSRLPSFQRIVGKWSRCVVDQNSKPPNVFSAKSIRPRTCSLRPTSAGWNAARPPALSISRTVSCLPGSSISHTTTQAPVTIATFPLIFIVGLTITWSRIQPAELVE